MIGNVLRLITNTQIFNSVTTAAKCTFPTLSMDILTDYEHNAKHLHATAWLKINC